MVKLHLLLAFMIPVRDRLPGVCPASPEQRRAQSHPVTLHERVVSDEFSVQLHVPRPVDGDSIVALPASVRSRRKYRPNVLIINCLDGPDGTGQ
jgi:hypothetical protein